MTLGEKIKYLRELKGVNQTDLGRVTGMTQRKVSYIECDKFEPSIQDIRALCRYFNVSADYLLGLPSKLPFPGP